MTFGLCDCVQGRLACRCKPDWSFAPPDATHWGPETLDYHASWYRLENRVWSGMTVDGHREFKEQCSWYAYGHQIHRTDLEARP